ncbi:hypothetical protein [Yinghuangia sp. YIM S10712]|uniref:hypothetical protein n=1 Tax=Yinghuangia sp. YIM S10712 TaxID=3436930 RepID=UPI003F52F1AB
MRDRTESGEPGEGDSGSAGPFGLPEAAQAVDAVAEVVRRATGSSGPPATHEVLEALTKLRVVRAELATWETELIAMARRGGASWADLAPALGVASRQAAERRYLRGLAPTAADPHTGEKRVQAERDRRAADRAVDSWARDNAARLRTLAGQVAAVQGLDAPGRDRVALLNQALGHSDPAQLLGPLADTRPHVDRSHPDLAAEIDAVTTHTARLRHDTTRRRRDFPGRTERPPSDDRVDS